MMRSIRISFVLWTILIIIGTLMPNLSLPNSFITWTDKVIHGVIFMIWGILFLLAFRKHARKILPFWAWGVSFGFLDEILQSLVSNRTTDFWDFIADIVGLIIAYGIYYGILKKASQYRLLSLLFSEEEKKEQ